MKFLLLYYSYLPLKHISTCQNINYTTNHTPYHSGYNFSCKPAHGLPSESEHTQTWKNCFFLFLFLFLRLLLLLLKGGELRFKVHLHHLLYWSVGERFGFSFLFLLYMLWTGLDLCECSSTTGLR